MRPYLYPILAAQPPKGLRPQIPTQSLVSPLSETTLISSGMAHASRPRIARPIFQILWTNDVRICTEPWERHADLDLERLSFTASSGSCRCGLKICEAVKRWRLAKPRTSRGLTNHGKGTS